MNVPIKYVNIYLQDRAYGGPEEGGWWYDYALPANTGDVIDDATGDPVPVSLRTVDYVRQAERLQLVCDLENEHRNADIGSSTSDGAYVVWTEDHPPRLYPETTPYYH